MKHIHTGLCVLLISLYAVSIGCGPLSSQEPSAPTEFQIELPGESRTESPKESFDGAGQQDAGESERFIDAGGLERISTDTKEATTPDGPVIPEQLPPEQAIDVKPPCSSSKARRTQLASGMTVVHHDGQSFVSWKDRKTGKTGEGYRYRLYRAASPIRSDADLQGATLVYKGILNHSGQLFGSSFTAASRLKVKPMSIVENGGKALDVWSGLAVATTFKNGCAYYAVLATDINDKPLESIQPGVNATTTALDERVGALQPLKVYDSTDAANRKYVEQTKITGQKNLPLRLFLHGSTQSGGGAAQSGDYYIYFGNPSMGYRDGVPGVFSIQELKGPPRHLSVDVRDAIIRPDGSRALETQWFGYVAQPGGGPRLAYPYTERRLAWIISWLSKRYNVDLNRITVAGKSMGGWGTMTWAFRHPELFAAVFPILPRFKQTTIASVVGKVLPQDKLPNGELWGEHHNTIRFVQRHPKDLPFLAWSIGRQDGFATWKEQVDMVKTMTQARHGFAFAWNNGNHGGASPAQKALRQWYNPKMFSKNESFPAFGNSSIDDDLGNGDPKDGDLEGGINLGFVWSITKDEAKVWQIKLSNGLAKAQMTVDVTPRRLQAFHPKAGESITIEHSNGTKSSAKVDTNGLVTAVGVVLQPNQEATLTFRRP